MNFYNKSYISGLILLVFAMGFQTMAFAGLDEGLAAINAKNYKLALEELKPLADNGDVLAQTNLGIMYENGQGVARDYMQATELFLKAAQKGDETALYNIVAMHGADYGVALRQKIALDRNIKAAYQGARLDSNSVNRH